MDKATAPYRAASAIAAAGLLFQVQPPPVGIDPFLWLVWVAVTGAIGKLYWDSRQESKRKDELIDRLLKAGLDNANNVQRSVSLLERERGKET